MLLVSFPSRFSFILVLFLLVKELDNETSSIDLYTFALVRLNAYISHLFRASLLSSSSSRPNSSSLLLVIVGTTFIILFVLVQPRYV